MSTALEFDIAIVGGGLAGGLAATALSDGGFSCALIDAQPLTDMQEAAYDGRTTAIAYASARVFRRLGLWDQIQDSAEPILDILTTDGRAATPLRDGKVSSFFLRFNSRELAEPAPLGWIAENRTIRSAIYGALEGRSSVSIFAPAMRHATQYEPGYAETTLADGQRLRSRLVIAADGRHSKLRSEAGLKTNEWRYKQTGIVATVAHERPHQGIAHEFFLPAGPFAILPMTNNRSSLVWTEGEAAATAYLELSDDDFRRELEFRFGPFLGALSVEGPRWSYPLAFTLAQSYAAPRLALIGDAAHAIHPIAGQGYNLGVKDIAALVDVLSDARALGQDIGMLNVLQNYERWRRFDSAALALGTDVLNRLFSNDFAPLRLARDIGMGAVGAIGPLRRFFMRQAGGDLGRLPSLMAADGV
ncbi:MAG: UbiH/UbiF/VisC/COQ6 family ubiquinone biosynthesis hydroxylase [Pseudomonadota bacterium]